MAGQVIKPVLGIKPDPRARLPMEPEQDRPAKMNHPFNGVSTSLLQNLDSTSVLVGTLRTWHPRFWDLIAKTNLESRCCVANQWLPWWPLCAIGQRPPATSTGLQAA